MIPHEYLNALDTLPSFVTMAQTGWVCHSAKFHPILQTRLPSATPPCNLVWVEPQIEEALPNMADLKRLIVITSRPLARILPERQGWADAPLGMQWNGMAKLKRRLSEVGWRISAEFHFHTLRSIMLNLASQQFARWGQPARADRWHFAARKRYSSSHNNIATVSLLVYDNLRT